MDKRYQVFVSSTYEDLKEERKEVMQVLLEFECIPAGMELFQASNETQWNVIKRVIEDCDYYLLIVGGRYGSVSPTGVGYTEMEYKYALEIGKPIISFCHSNPGSLPASDVEQTDDGKAKLEEFLELVKSKMCKPWENAKDLGSAVLRSINELKKNEPAVGWVRADTIDQASSGQIVKLKERIEELTNEVSDLKFNKPEGTEELSQGEDEHEIALSLRGDYYDGYSTVNNNHEFLKRKLSFTWNGVCRFLLPNFLIECGDREAKEQFERFLLKELSGDLSEGETKNLGLDSASNLKTVVSLEDYRQVLFQIRGLGLIQLSDMERIKQDTSTYWTITSYGDVVLTRLMAIKKTG